MNSSQNNYPVLEKDDGFIPDEEIQDDGFIPDTEEVVAAPKKSKKKEEQNSFSKGLSRSVSGQIVGAAKGEKQEADTEKPGFWSSLVEEAGTFAGDAPYFAAGGTLGAAAGSLGGPVGTVVGAGAGAFALPAFLKASIKEYRDFQDKGGDLTFGQFLESADTVASKTLKEGAFGVILGSIGKGVPLLRKIPGVGALFDTKYAGKAAKEALTITGEAGAATVIPAALEGRLPDSEDFAKALALTAGGKGISIAGDLHEQYNTKKADKFNYALANNIKQENLAYPPLQELNQKAGQVYKNNVALDQNLAAFSESYIEALKGKVDALSPRDFQSSQEAGLAIRETLAGHTPDTSPPVEEVFASKITDKPAPSLSPEVGVVVKPALQDNPIIKNPLEEGINTVSKRKFKSDADVGRNIKQQYQDNRAEAKMPLDDRFTDFKKDTRAHTISDDLLPIHIEDFMSEFAESGVPNSPENIVRSQAMKLLNLVAEVKDGAIIGVKPVNLEKLIKTNRSIKSRPDWELPADYKQNLARLTNKVDEVISGHLDQIDPALAAEYRGLNNDYRMFKNRFDNDAMRIFWDETESSESIYQRFTKLDDFNQLTQALSTNQYGTDLLNDVRAEVWRKNIGEKALTAKTESAFAGAVNSVSERDFANLMEFLEPEQRNVMNTQVRQVNDIRRSVEKSGQEYAKQKQMYEAAKREQKRAADRIKKGEGTLKDRAKADADLQKRFEAQQAAKTAYDNQILRLKSKSDQNAGGDVQAKQDLLVSILSENPATIASNMHSIEGIRRMKEATKNVKGGKDLYDAAAKFETQRMFNFVRESYIDTQTVPFKSIKKAMTNKEFRSKLTELNGKQWLESVDRLVEISDQLSDSYKDLKIKFRDDPGTLASMVNIATMLGVAHGELVIPSALQVGKAAVTPIHSWWQDKKQYTQERITSAVKAAQAMRSGSPSAIKKGWEDMRKLLVATDENDKKKGDLNKGNKK